MRVRNPIARHRTQAFAAIATITAAAAAAAGAAPTAVAAGPPACTDITPITVSDYQTQTVRSFTPGDTAVHVAFTGGWAPALAYGRDGSLFGVTPPPAHLWEIDPETGATHQIGPLHGALGTGAVLFGLTGLPDGSLLAAASTRSHLYAIDPATGEASEWAQLPLSPAYISDLLPLPGGEALFIGAKLTLPSPPAFEVYRARRGEQAIRVGTVPYDEWGVGLARSGGTIRMIIGQTTLHSLGPIPHEASDQPIPSTATPINLGSTPWDAASPGDLCTALTADLAADRSTATTLPIGDEITYTLTLANAEGTAHAPVEHVLDLTGLVDDAELITGPAAAAGSGLVIGPVTTGGGRTTATVTGEVPTGAGTTITLTARITGAGDRRAAVHLFEAGRADPAACDPAAGTCVAHHTAAPPPAPLPQPHPAPTPATQPAPPVATPLGAPTLTPLTPTTTRITQRLRLPRAGRHTLILRDRVTGKRLRWLRGSRIGARTLRGAASAPVHTTTAPDRRLVVHARVAAPARRVRSGRVQLRVILNRPGNPLSDVVLGVAPARG